MTIEELIEECKSRNLHVSVTYQKSNDYSVEIYTNYESTNKPEFYTDGHTILQSAIQEACDFLEDDNKPKVHGCYNTRFLAESVKCYIDYLDSGKYNCDRAVNYENHILETAITTMTNDKVYDWINRKIEESEK